MKFGLIANTRKELFWEKLPALLKWFKQENIDLVVSKRIAENPESGPIKFPVIAQREIPGACDMILAIGGDGTILHTVQLIGQLTTPILGINVGGLGFLTDISYEDFTTAFSGILNGEYTIEDRLIVEGRIAGEDRPLYGLNEIIIDKGSSIRVIQIQIDIDGEFLNSYVADGLLVSTPTGSTGYSLASGGPIIVPSSKVLIINPTCPHSLTNRPVIIPDTVSIRAITRTEHKDFIVAADGRDVRRCSTRTEITVRKAPFAARLVKPLNSHFFRLLHTKLNWSEDFRDKKRWSHDS